MYYKRRVRGAEEIEREERIKNRIDYWHTKSPCSGVRKLRRLLREHDGLAVGRNLVFQVIKRDNAAITGITVAAETQEPTR